MSEIFSPIVFELGLGAVGGFVVGFALKKLAKLFIVLIGILIIVLLYLGASDVISINFNALLSTVSDWLGGAASWLAGLISLLPFIGSFLVGFLLGLKIG